ncbi:hypothetical protein IFM89_016306 [Coptis chinensis]|uniref:Uncharacterized protein n=1 Tax=Coptis chinensis TaxID=261450 RepID=A0A835H498_9MAGN|nr:hypothetical protein IFM89_016306 [Coptis chinensis]
MWLIKQSVSRSQTRRCSLPRLRHIQGSSLEGTIPAGISALTILSDLRISDSKGTEFDFPQLSTMKSMKTLILRNCMIHGNIPEYIGELKKLKNL